MGFAEASKLRQILYLICVALCCIINPGFLFADIYSDVDSRSSGLPICAMWVMAPGTFVARALLSTVWRECGCGLHICNTLPRTSADLDDDEDVLSPKADAIGALMDLCGLMALGASLGEGNLTIGVRRQRPSWQANFS